MTSGKTQVGRTLARRLRWRHVDLDREIERRTGQRISEIFAAQGEAAFRSLEVQASGIFLSGDRIVVSPGGGWITNPGVFESLPPETLTVWLKVSPAEVLRRLARSQARSVRPLLRQPDPARVEELLAVREALYARAAIELDTDHRSVTDVVTELFERIRANGHGSSRPEL
ncbi:MAG: shikimate kinase [Gemmatimonas sp.]|nr:shikimate kinase [Gemmatimonas sp.]